MEFKSLKNIETSFRQIRLFGIVFLCLCALVSVFSVVASFRFAEKQREKIITQKWIALYPLGTEAWAEQRRTGYPRFYPTPTSTNASNEPNLPTEGASRIPFAPNEQTRNADNYDAAVALLGAGGDKFGTRLWWDVKTDKPAW